MDIVLEWIGLAALLVGALIWYVRSQRQPACPQHAGRNGCSHCPLRNDCAGLIMVEADEEPAPRRPA
ncbi:MAG TPA: hypothetical protein PLY66_04100 [Acidobacteriota bacterium]|nr:hypothetical protein [Acidobacteriota bacterium]HOT00167.1 hypothetical protein [Acidobacteriota bacterium]HQF87351.1 hypothetical protein [Acidobacteriota bacterium]HQG91925.1 hypothetical protein [Acidobacteriota bacterium]HQK89438.1 hypothetical protein [Acidobacteriota bacterium]